MVSLPFSILLVEGRRGSGVVVGLIFQLSLFSCQNPPQAPNPPLRIGVVLEEGPDLTPLARSLELGIAMAYEEIRAAPEIGGSNLEVEFLILPEGEISPEERFKKLKDKGIVGLIVGPRFPLWLKDYLGGEALTLVGGVPLFLEPLSSPSAHAPHYPPQPVTLTDLKESQILFLGTDQELEARATAEFLLTTYSSLKEIGVVYEESPWGIYLYRTFSAAIPLPGPVLRPISYSPGATIPRFREVTAFSQAATPFALYVIGTPEIIPELFLELRGSLPSQALILLASTCGEPEDSSSLPIPSHNLFRLAPTPSTAGTISLFAREFQRRYGRELDLPAAYGYDALILLALALVKKEMIASGVELWELVRGIASPSSRDHVQPIYPLDYRLGRALILKGQDIDYEGASGDFFFDKSGERRDGFFTLFQAEDREGGKIVFSPVMTQRVAIPHSQ